MDDGADVYDVVRVGGGSRMASIISSHAIDTFVEVFKPEVPVVGEEMWLYLCLWSQKAMIVVDWLGS